MITTRGILGHVTNKKRIECRLVTYVQIEV
jgi:hypothetical protein